MKAFKWTLAVALILGVFAAPLERASADETRPAKSKFAGRTRHLGKREILKKLQLSDGQLKQLRERRAAFRKKMAEIDGQIKVQKVELESEMEKPQPDREKLDVITKKISDLKGAKLSEKVKAKVELEKEILTPEQVEKMKALQQGTAETEAELDLPE
jgi:Spy/CpxP family protein refolding chaperone